MPSDGGIPGEQTRMRYDSLQLIRLVRAAQRVHVEHSRFPVELVEQGGQFKLVVRTETIVGVKPENPVAGRMAQALIAGGGEIIAPNKIVYLGREAAGHLAGFVAGARIDNHNLVEQLGNRREALRKLMRLVADNHAQRNGRAAVWIHGFSAMTKRRTVMKRNTIAVRAGAIRQAPFRKLVQMTIASNRLSPADFTVLRRAVIALARKTFFIRGGLCRGKKSHKIERRIARR